MDFSKYDVSVALPTYNISQVQAWFAECIFGSDLYKVVENDHSTQIHIKPASAKKSVMGFPLIMPEFMNATSLPTVNINIKIEWNHDENAVITTVRSRNNVICEFFGNDIGMDSIYTTYYSIEYYRKMADALVSGIKDDSDLKEVIERAYGTKVCYFNELKPAYMEASVDNKPIRGWIVLYNTRDAVKLGLIATLNKYGEYYYACRNNKPFKLDTFGPHITISFPKRSEQ